MTVSCGHLPVFDVSYVAKTAMVAVLRTNLFKSWPFYNVEIHNDKNHFI
jgi:hypothetical protein